MIATADINDPDSLLRYSKVLQLMKEMREQGARIVALATEGDREVPRYSDSCLFVPASNDLLSTILEVVPLQLLAYALAISRGIDVDRPRNLVKAVVEE
jgi:glucosamine--fructose-6-phosphate aminotransferase (isomerizing)